MRRDAYPDCWGCLMCLCCREKPLAMCVHGPYRKPTQVVWLRILRRSGELWLRNSAKCPRNFGRRGAMCGNHPLCGVRCVWPQRSEGSDCLLKTQVRAKTLQVEVYGLTPARCWKVKRTREHATWCVRRVIEAPVNGGGNYNHPKVAKFLVG